MFSDPLSRIVLDDFSGEERWITTGRSTYGTLLRVVHTDRGSVTRLISARRLTPRERDEYEEGR